MRGKDMQLNSVDYLQKTGRWRISLEVFALKMIISMSFLAQFFDHILRENSVYFILFFGFVCMYVLSERIILKRRNSLNLLWLITICGMVLGYISSVKTMSVLADVVFIFCGIIMIWGCSVKEIAYSRSIRNITRFAVFFAISVWIQILLPSAYDLYLNLLLPDKAQSIIALEAVGMYAGFTSNPGFIASYLVVGILAALASYQSNSNNRKSFALIGFLFLTLLLTGKRAHLLFIILTYIFLYLSSNQLSIRVKRYWRIFISVMAIVILFILLQEVLSTIPALARIIETIEMFLEGEDVSSNRFALYNWGWNQFLENPILGIGWGNFRRTIVGSVTIRTQLQTHNIYIQLLCETGVVGFFSFIIPMVAFLVATKRAYCKCVSSEGQDGPWRMFLYFSFAYQMFFLLYGFTGNPLYDINSQIMYFFACSILSAYKLKNWVQHS